MGRMMNPRVSVQGDAVMGADEVLGYLSPQLVAILGGLCGAPASVIESTIQLLPFGSRAGLEATGVVVRNPDGESPDHYLLRLTQLGWQVIDEAAHAVEQHDDDADLEVRAAQALAARR